MARVRRNLPLLALLTIVAASTLAHWLAGRRIHGLWIMPDEAIYAERAFAAWRQGPVALVHGPLAGYGLLYPVVAGLPLSIGDTATGYATLKLVQALIVSLAAVPVFFFGRRLMPPRYALVAAALTVASPVLLYSGFVMTEVVFYPVAACALLAIAHAVSTSAIRHQALALALIGVAVATRAQAIVFIAVFAAAIALDAAFARNPGKLRRYWPTWSLLAACAVAAVAEPRLIGAYSGTLRGGYPLGPSLGLVFDHLSYAALSTGVVPFAALLFLAVQAARGQELDPGTRALIAVAVSSVALLVVQVGFFAARYSPHLLGRDLAPLPPLLFLILAVWLARGGASKHRGRALAAFAAACVLLLAPWDRLVVPAAFADTPDLLLISRVHAYAPATVVTIAAVVALFAFVLLTRRALLVVPLLIAAVLAAASTVAALDLARAANGGQVAILGTNQDWIDQTAASDVTYLYGNEQFWNVVWQERFWNRRIDRVLSIAPSLVPGPMPQTSVRLRPDGRLPVSDRYVVASNIFSFVGEPVATLAQTGLDVTGLTLWRLDGPPRLSTQTRGIQPNGDMTSPGTVTVYGCQAGRLELILLPKATTDLRIFLNGRLVLRRRFNGEPSWAGFVRVDPPATTQRCTFTIAGQLLLGSTRIAFVRD
jgi:hypothetical protein